MINANVAVYTARDAKTRFGEVLDAALGSPVGISKHDRLAAYMVSKRDFEAMQEKIQSLEDQLWLIKAESARAEGFAAPEHVDAFLSKLRNSIDEPKNNKASP